MVGLGGGRSRSCVRSWTSFRQVYFTLVLLPLCLATHSTYSGVSSITLLRNVVFGFNIV